MSILPYIVGAFMAVVGAGLGAGGVKARRNSAQAAKWPVAKGTVTSSEVVKHTRSGIGQKGHATKMVSWEPVIKYGYEVEGKKLKGGAIGLGSIGTGKGRADALVARYPQGSAVDVHYNPADPKQACLDPKSDGSASLFLIGAAVIAAGLLIIVNAPLFAKLFSADIP